MKKTLVSLAIILVLCLTGICTAAEDLTIAGNISYDPGTRTLSFLVNDNRATGSEPELAEVSFDGITLQDTVYRPLADSGIPLVFCFVVDTTPTAFSYQTRIPGQLAEALAGYRGNKADQYYLISYDSEVHEPAGPASSPDVLFGEIKYAGGYNIVGDYSAALMKAVEVLDAHDGFCKKVIFLITDGNQVKNPFLADSGINGLLVRLGNAGYPVYSFGLIQSETEEYDEASLKRIQSISSAAGGMYISYKDNPEPWKDFYDQIRRSGVISGTVPADYGRDAADPAAMTVRLLRSGGSEIRALTANIALPVIEGTPAEIEIVPTAEPEPEVIPEVTGTWLNKVKAVMLNTFGENWMYIAGAGVLLIVLIILIIIIAGKSRRSGKGAKSKSKKETGSGSVSSVLPDPEQTAPIDFRKEDDSAPCLTYLTDLKHGVTCSASLRDGQSAAFGRLNDKASGVTGLGGDPHISRKQFTLTNDNGKIILEDSDSENGTYLNGEKISGKTVVRAGDTIRIGGIAGEREFRVSITAL